MSLVNMKTIIACLLLSLLVFIYGCNQNSQTQHGTHDSLAVSSSQIKPVNNNEEQIRSVASEILLLLKNKGYVSLAPYFHPTKGVLFSPYGFIDTATAKTFDKTTYTTLLRNLKTIHWGQYDGTGDPIDLTIPQYMGKFVYSADFVEAEKTAFNQIIKKGNSLINLSEVFPDASFIEYHFSGFNEQYAGMDWTSLRLVFEFYEGNYYLVAVVHDQWTS